MVLLFIKALLQLIINLEQEKSELELQVQVYRDKISELQNQASTLQSVAYDVEYGVNIDEIANEVDEGLPPSIHRIMEQQDFDIRQFIKEMYEDEDETRITQDIIQRIKDMGGDAYHVHGNGVQRKGEPDIDGILPNGVSLKVEVKTPTGKPSPIQVHRVAKYRELGHVAGIVTSVEEFVDLLTGWVLCNIPRKYLEDWYTPEQENYYE